MKRAKRSDSHIKISTRAIDNLLDVPARGCGEGSSPLSPPRFHELLRDGRTTGDKDLREIVASIANRVASGDGQRSDIFERCTDEA
jgi:hypothetical protein